MGRNLPDFRAEKKQNLITSLAVMVFGPENTPWKSTCFYNAPSLHIVDRNRKIRARASGALEGAKAAASP